MCPKVIRMWVLAQVHGYGDTEIAPSRPFLSGYKYFTQIQLNDKKTAQLSSSSVVRLWSHITGVHTHSRFVSSRVRHLAHRCFQKQPQLTFLVLQVRKKVNISSGFTSFSLQFKVRNLNTIKPLGQRSSSENSVVCLTQQLWSVHLRKWTDKQDEITQYTKQGY